MLKVFIVDDETPARQELRYLLEQFADVEVIGEAASGDEAIECIPEAEPDAVFLDIHLHDRDGVDVGEELLELMARPPVIIFASAYEIHAVRAFETEAVDYIVKPFSEHRLEKTISRVRRLRPKGESDEPEAPRLEQKLHNLLKSVLAEQQPRRIPVERNGKIMLIDPNEIVFATVDGRCATIYTESEQYATSFTLQELESRLSAQQFFRTHRAFIVNLYRTAELVPWFKGAVYLVMQDAKRTEVPVSRNVVKELKKQLGF
ncbi:LytTR family DNA-binding domain-containing protein [Brevibacillus ruminantium]|uniref:LytTR family DNA-binding domain-containing protein n=1 Tax=Brevibacillus ruminantium TaxID=2950604 RepID=A0ABY4WIU3_9BACL|nr:LytTR family DNA-binding domain-containing protein [Brevibacillus ruminantium]USG67065.1 LytTR family DNA-binding domain-containing protein [Brevibacillus ruminantium]